MSRSIPLRQRLPRGSIVVAPVEAAKQASLHYTSDTEPGIRRLRKDKDFRYLYPDNRTIRDPRVRRRIKSLAVPPAWTDVWICLDPDGHLQATGRDQRGRKQHRYHPRWREVRDESKYSRTLAFARALPAIRCRVEADLSGRGLTREKVLATIVRLLESTLIRIGNEEYARSNGSFGLTTLRDRHVRIEGATLTFAFRGKSGIVQQVRLTDRRLARIVKSSQDVPGQILFQYLNEAGERQPIGSADVNAYLREAGGEDFSAKDFRTWAGTVLALEALGASEAPATKAAARRGIGAAIRSVAARLGNTPAVCRKCYVHPTVLDAYGAGDLHRERGGKPLAVTGLTEAECRLLVLLEQRAGTARNGRKKVPQLGLEQALRRSLKQRARPDAG